MRWIIQFLSRGGEEDEPTLGTAPVEDDHDFVVGPLLTRIGSLVPDRHRPTPVLAGGNGSAEGPVLQRVVLDVDGQMVVVAGGRQALREGPRNQDSVPLQPEIPVEARGMVLLNDEAEFVARAGGGPTRLVWDRLRCGTPEALLPVVRQWGLRHVGGPTHVTTGPCSGSKTRSRPKYLGRPIYSVLGQASGAFGSAHPLSWECGCAGIGRFSGPNVHLARVVPGAPMVQSQSQE